MLSGCIENDVFNITAVFDFEFFPQNILQTNTTYRINEYLCRNFVFNAH